MSRLPPGLPVSKGASAAAAVPALLVGAAALAYASALSASFQFDDFNVIVDNPAVHSLTAWWQGMPGMRPLLKLSYALNWVADTEPIGFHAVNVLLHLINIGLVWRLSAHLPLPAGWRGEAREGRVRLLATLLFALHPVQTESVTYVSGRSMSLMASFALAGLIVWLEAPTSRRATLARLAAVVLLCAAILTKEVAVVLPLALLLFPQNTNTRQAPVALAGLALIALFIVFGYARLLTEPAPRSLGVNLLSELNAVYYLLGQLFRPHALDIDPRLPELRQWSALSVWQATGFVAAVGVAWGMRKRRPWLTFAVGWFVLLLLPAYSLIPRHDLASERHLYLAALGPFWLAGIALASLRSRVVWATTTLALAVAGMAGTHLRNADYRDEVSLWRQTVAVSPVNPRAWNNLGWAYLLVGRRDDAQRAFARALAIDPGHVRARQNLDYLMKATP